jgi:hypothetical protein
LTSGVTDSDFVVPLSVSMMRPAFRPRPLGLALVFVVAAAMDCGDGLSPLRSAGSYRLVAVNGQPVPYTSPPSMGLPMRITRGDLVLRPNGTFRHGLGGDVGFGFVSDGTYHVGGGEIAFHGATPLDGTVAPMSGDSIIFAYPGLVGSPLTLTYRRAQLQPSTLPTDRYRLRSINGRIAEPLVAFDTTIGDQRSVGYVAFDSLIFSDGVFVRRHRSESAVGYTNGEVTTVSESEWTTWGAYESRPGSVLLFHYSPPFGVAARDSLSTRGDTLVRRTALITGIQEERYTRP